MAMNFSRLVFVVIKTCFYEFNLGAGINADLTLTLADVPFSLQTLHVLLFLLGLSCPVVVLSFLFITLLHCIIDGT